MGKISLGTSIIYDDTVETATSEIKYKSHVLPVYTAGATSLSLTVPTDTVEGDLLIVCLFARSLVTTPLGWTRVIKQSINTANTQWLEVYYKIASASDIGSVLTFTQASAVRMAISLIVATCPANGVAIDNFSGSSDATIATIPTITSTGLGRLCLIAHTSYYSFTSGKVEYYLNGNKWIIINDPFIDLNRFAISICHLNNGTRPSSIIITNAAISDTASIAVIFKPI